MGLFPTPLPRSGSIYLQWLVTVTNGNVEMGPVKPCHEGVLEDPALKITHIEKIGWTLPPRISRVLYTTTLTPSHLSLIRETEHKGAGVEVVIHRRCPKVQRPSLGWSLLGSDTPDLPRDTVSGSELLSGGGVFFCLLIVGGS